MIIKEKAIKLLRTAYCPNGHKTVRSDSACKWCIETKALLKDLRKTTRDLVEIELLVAMREAREALRYNIAIYSRKDEKMMLRAMKALDRAVKRTRK